MSIESRSRQYGKVFDHWQIREFLGSGSGGKTAVFRLVRSDSNRGVSALKVVNLIEVRGNIHEFSGFQRREYETARDACSRSAEQEVWLMDELRGNTNIVDYLDHTFVDWSDETGFGRDLLIRMEFLKDLRSDLQRGRIFSETEVLKIGSDICIALIRCHRKNILHRDVKPENIFRNKDGDYKLGDFGVSRVLDACPGAVASTGIGTYEYLPAEQITGRYDKRVDIYSLGLVLYELCNQNRLPFAASTYATGREVSMRLMGTPLPEPIDARPALAEVILKACAFDPKDRYQSAEELLRALHRVSNNLPKTAERKTAGNHVANVPGKTEYATVPAEASEETIPFDNYRTMPASADAQRERTSILEKAEKYVPRFASRITGVVGIAGIMVSVALLLWLVLGGVYNRKPVSHEKILPTESLENVVNTETAPAVVTSEIKPEEETTETKAADLIKIISYGTSMRSQNNTGRNQYGKPVWWQPTVTLRFDGDPEIVQIEPDFDCSNTVERQSTEDLWGWAVVSNSNNKKRTFPYVRRINQSFGLEYYIYMPDNPDCAGRYGLKFVVGDQVIKTVKFTLTYEGNYSIGTGWSMSDVVWS